LGNGEKKKRDVDAEKNLDVAVPGANDTSSLLACDDGLGKRAKRLVF
jgi:hypothetical protein